LKVCHVSYFLSQGPLDKNSRMERVIPFHAGFSQSLFLARFRQQPELWCALPARSFPSR
jgi:hypothetical protein